MPVKRQQLTTLSIRVCLCVRAFYKYMKLYLNVSKQTAISNICLTESSLKTGTEEESQHYFQFYSFWCLICMCVQYTLCTVWRVRSTENERNHLIKPHTHTLTLDKDKRTNGNWIESRQKVSIPIQKLLITVISLDRILIQMNSRKHFYSSARVPMCVCVCIRVFSFHSNAMHVSRPH